jgi:hypothetical protein
VTPGKSSVPIHNKRNVFGYGALLQRADEKFADLVDGPFGRWRGYEPSFELGQVH